jgi:hypothetical protein
VLEAKPVILSASERQLPSGGRVRGVAPSLNINYFLVQRESTTTMTDDTKTTDAMLAHNVFFTLHDDSEVARKALVQECRKFLTGHSGTVFFAVGTLTEDLNRPVNDREFHVALHIVFASRRHHDDYQTHARHLEFIESNKANWKRVRVFDSELVGA